MELIPKQMRSNHRLIVFLVAVVTLLENNPNTFLIVMSLIEGYILAASTYDFVTTSILISNFSRLSFRSDACTMVTHL